MILKHCVSSGRDARSSDDGREVRYTDQEYEDDSSEDEDYVLTNVLNLPGTGNTTQSPDNLKMHDPKVIKAGEAFLVIKNAVSLYFGDKIVSVWIPLSCKYSWEK